MGGDHTQVGGVDEEGELGRGALVGGSEFKGTTGFKVNRAAVLTKQLHN